MKQKVYWKDLCHSFTSSKGRFLSILTLMMLGTLALVGLKVTTPNMHRTAQRFIDNKRCWTSLSWEILVWIRLTKKSYKD